MTENEKARPLRATVNVSYNRKPLSNLSREISSHISETLTLKPQVRNATANIKTADLSHITDTRSVSQLPSFIPAEYTREMTTPIPLRPGPSTLDPSNKQWKTTIFPSPNPTDSREEVENLGQWLNQVLEKNQKETQDPIELAKNARHWFTIAYEELCRQVSVECPERSTLLLSIWKRYQSLFARVVQLHQEEKDYLLTCHRERTSALTGELDQYQSKLKQVTQQYRDDQERWSNAREKEETKFTNMRKKLDLQVRNKRSLTMQIKALRDRLEREGPAQQVVQDNDTKEEVEKETLTPAQLLERANNIRHKFKSEFPNLSDCSSALDDIIRYLNNDLPQLKQTRELFPSLFKDVSIGYTPRQRSLKWVYDAITFSYAHRLKELSSKKAVFDWAPSRQHFANSIYYQFLVMYGNAVVAAETFYDLVESARCYAEKGHVRCKTFLQFIDVIQPYRDCIYLDFYCFCLGSFLQSNISQNSIFFDEFSDSETLERLSSVSYAVSLDLVKKVLYNIAEQSSVDNFMSNIKEQLKIEDVGSSVVSYDDLFEYMMTVFAEEERRMMEQLREQYEMDAAQYGGIITLGQFQTLAMFSSKKLDQRIYTDMMREILMRTKSRVVSFQAFVDTMHRYSMLVPFTFERIEYDFDDHPDDILEFMKEEYSFNLPELKAELEKSRKNDENLFKQLVAAKARFEQVMYTKKIGSHAEVAQRELYEILWRRTPE